MGLFEDLFSAAFNGEEPPPIPSWVKWKHISKGLTHCPVCLKLDQCWFTDDKKPLLPQHPHCHCIVEPIPLSTVVNEANAESKIEKYSDYLFNPKYDYNGKRALFEAWGYSKIDSEMLLKELERQALEEYIRRDFELGKLDMYGQRINIQIELDRKDKEETVHFISGWMIYPAGKIKLNTPYGDE